VEDQSAPIPGERTSKLGGSMDIVRRAQSRIDQATLENVMGIEKMYAGGDGTASVSTLTMQGYPLRVEQLEQTA
jgi:hypothetical protein